MTAPSSSQPQPIDASCRLPLFALFGGAAVWLVLGSVLALIASLTFHKPAMFADCAMFSYGRAFPASQNLLVYGFCIPAGLGVGLWLLARLSRVELARPWLVTVGAKLWHLGVLVGLVAILTGQGTGHELLEMPHYATAILFVSFLFMAVWGFVTHTQRAERSLYPSQWFVLAALFWFPWILSTAVLLQLVPLRGVVQAVVAWWFAGNLLNVWLVLAGLASTFYIIPKLADRPLQSQNLALFIFLTLMLFGTWTGVPASAPLPAWMPVLSGVASSLLLVTALAVAVCVYQTTRGVTWPPVGGPACYTMFGVFSLVLAMLLFSAGCVPVVSRVTDFTWFGRGEIALRLYGFFVMTMLGAAYFILPRLAGVEVCRPRVRANFWLGVAGTLLVSVPLLIGGVRQGLALANPAVPFLDTGKAALMYFRMSTLGETLLVLGNLLFLFNVVTVIVRCYRPMVKAAYREATALSPEGVQT